MFDDIDDALAGASAWPVSRKISFARNLHEHANSEPVAPSQREVEWGRSDGDTDWEETTNERLFDIKLIPVCSPEFLAKADGIKPETNLGSYSLLQSLARPADWDNWAASVGMALSDRSRLHFESSSRI